jgi:thioredoxin-like negative regulator of GroEL
MERDQRYKLTARLCLYAALLALLPAAAFTACSSAGQVTPLTTAAFKKHIFNYTGQSRWQPKNKAPVVLLFIPRWHEEAGQQQALLKKMALLYPHYRFYTVDTETEKELALFFDLKVHPTYIFITASGAPQAAQGLLSEEALSTILSALSS